MKRYIRSSEETHMRAIFGNTFNRVRNYMNTTQCGFITAFREYDKNHTHISKTENRKRNKELEALIKSSGLTYHKAHGGFIEHDDVRGDIRVTEDTFVVVNNRFTLQDFTKLMLDWCRKFDQEAILITMPDQNSTKNAINVEGRYYDANGNVTMSFDHATVQDAEEYFTNICGKDFVLSSVDVIETLYEKYQNTAGYVMARRDFKQMYPDL